VSGFLSADDLAAIRALKAGDHINTITIWRAPTTSGGKRGAVAQVGTASGRIWPAAQAQRIIAALPELAQVRYESVGFFSDTSGIALGDELRSGTTRYEVVGLGTWRTASVAALAKVVI
jgi:hypothetical protein